ncbi:MAG TPA: hypothetical protein VGI20_05070, partial [Rhizomicrobium sp.]
MLQRFNGVLVRRVIDRSCARVPEHAHDWPVLSLYVMGGYSNCTEIGETSIAGPSVILYRAGAAHQNIVASAGFEQIEIEFDPAWLGRGLLPDFPVSRWLGGRIGAAARALTQICACEMDENCFRSAVQRFMENAAREPARDPPRWLGTIRRRLGEDDSTNVTDLARQIRRH